MNTKRSISYFLCCLCIVLGSSKAQSCGGNGGNGGLTSTPLAIGTTITLQVSGSPGAAYGLLFSGGINPMTLPGIGPVCIDLASPFFLILAQGALNASGTFDLPIAIPNDPALLSAVAYLQAGVSDSALPGGLAITPALRVDFENADSFSSVPPLATARALATGSNLGDGRVLVAGGGGGTLLGPVGTSSTDIYNPVTRAMTPGPAMSVARATHTATTLLDGRVLVTGGLIDNAGTITASCEIFDPATDTWGAAAAMGNVRGGHSATRLNDGRVLVVGGTSTFALPPGSTNFSNILNAAQTTGEVYDPVANTWTAVGNVMSSKRFYGNLATLSDGRALAISGLNGGNSVFGAVIPSFTNTCDFYDPITNLFSSAPAIPTARAAAGTFNLSNGDLWVAGGGVSLFGVPTATTETLVFDGMAWTTSVNLPAAVTLPSIAALSDGRAFVVGGVTQDLLNPSATSVAAIFDGTTINPVASLPGARGGCIAVPLLDSGVLIAGGGDDSATSTAQADAWIYTP